MKLLSCENCVNPSYENGNYGCLMNCHAKLTKPCLVKQFVISNDLVHHNLNQKYQKYPFLFDFFKNQNQADMNDIDCQTDFSTNSGLKNPNTTNNQANQSFPADSNLKEHNSISPPRQLLSYLTKPSLFTTNQPIPSLQNALYDLKRKNFRSAQQKLHRLFFFLFGQQHRRSPDRGQPFNRNLLTKYENIQGLWTLMNKLGSYTTTSTVSSTTSSILSSSSINRFHTHSPNIHPNPFNFLDLQAPPKDPQHQQSQNNNNTNRKQKMSCVLCHDSQWIFSVKLSLPLSTIPLHSPPSVSPLFNLNEHSQLTSQLFNPSFHNQHSISTSSYQQNRSFQLNS